MDFGFTEEQEKLRKEVHDFIINELPEDYRGSLFGVTPINEECASFSMELQKKAGKRGWLTSGWSKEYGGLGLSDIEHGVIREELGRWVLNWPNYVGSEIGGPAVLLFASEEQKKKLLPPVAEGKVQWDQLFTEPNAGSDESNIQTRAVADGDDFIFNGQKMFVGEVYESDYLYTLARTEDTTPRHKGLTLFLIPANLPGISSRPLYCINGQTKREFFFDDVRVSKECMLGELNRGFYNAMASLQLERAFLGNPVSDKRDLEEFVQYCKETKRKGKPLIEDPQVRDALAQMAIELEVNRLASWRTVWRASQQEEMGPLDYDLSTFFRRTFTTSRCKMMMDIMGQYSQLQTGSKYTPMEGVIERKWLRARSLHAGGSTEILKVVLAARGLGLPRKR